LARCAAIKPNGEPCKVDNMPDAEWCWSHYPDYEEQRRWRASKAGKTGGRRRPVSELSEAKTLLANVTARVLQEEGSGPLLLPIAPNRSLEVTGDVISVCEMEPLSL
jgi:hypothetical protein